MKQIKLIILFLFSLNLISQNCNFKDVINETLVEAIKYSETNDYTNLEEALYNKELDFIGYIGNNKKKLKVVFTSLKQDKEDLNCYLIEGYTTVSNSNKRSFKGEMDVISNFVFVEPMYSEEEASKKYGFSTLKFNFFESSEESSTGIFDGRLVIMWNRDGNKARYEDIFEGYDGSRNYQFLGTWTSYKTKKSQIVAWGQYRIPCADDLDVGAGEFSPNPKYYKYGWANYKP